MSSAVRSVALKIHLASLWNPSVLVRLLFNFLLLVRHFAGKEKLFLSEASSMATAAALPPAPGRPPAPGAVRPSSSRPQRSCQSLLLVWLTLIGMRQGTFHALVLFEQICQLNLYQKFPNFFEGENWHQSGEFDTLPSSLSLVKDAPRWC